ncbi:hypothetical protein [Bordetella sp. LUAb4]|uniref:hypothetical protein n=1 Tax=Bordetella sp. LUAb4 TaxID=2843195 RepID=UPI001E5CEB35|nr:hypothetical protein [Bordetella sp. LUAb4]
MALDGEPKDGDYVRYVERLVHRGMPAPGQVGRQAGRGATGGAAGPSPGDTAMRGRERDQTRPDRNSATGTGPGKSNGAGTRAAEAAHRAYPAGSPARDASPDNGQAQAMQTGSGTGQAPSLAARSAQRKVSSVVFVVALLIGWHAMRLILAAIDDGHVDVSAILPGAFLLAFALMVYGISRNIRRNAERPAGKLPPLTTVSVKKPGQGR